MGGGFDLQLRLRFGMELEARLQAVIRKDYRGRLPIGKAVNIATGHPKHPFVVFSPTLSSHMGIVRHPADVRKAAAAAFLTVVELASRSGDIGTVQGRVIMPGFGTGMGGLDPAIAGRAVFRGFNSVFAQS